MKNYRKIYSKIGFNTLIQLVGKIISVAAGFVTVFFLSRYLGTSGYGDFTLAFTFVSFFSVIADFGLQTTMVRELSQNEHSKKFSSFLFLKISLSIIASVVALVVLFFFPYEVSLKIAIIIAIIAVTVSNITTYGTIIFQSRIRLDLVTYVDVITKLFTVVFILIFIYLQLNIYYIVATVLLGNLVGLFITFYLLRGNLQFTLNFTQTKHILILSFPIGVTTFLGLASFKIDTLMLSFMKSSNDVGLYSLSYKVLENFLVVWGFYMASVYPLLSKYRGKNDTQQIRALVKNSLITALCLSVLIIFIGYLFAPLIIAIFGGEEFQPSTQALKILVFALPFLFINNLFTDFFFSAKANNLALIGIILSLIVNVILNLWLIPLYGFIGASYVTVISAAFMTIYCIIQVFLLRKILFSNA